MSPFSMSKQHTSLLIWLTFPSHIKSQINVSISFFKFIRNALHFNFKSTIWYQKIFHYYSFTFVRKFSAFPNLYTIFHSINNVLPNFRYNNCLRLSCLFMDRDEVSTIYRRPSIDVPFQVSVYLAKRFHRRRFKCEKLTDDGRQLMAKASTAFRTSEPKRENNDLHNTIHYSNWRLSKTNPTKTRGWNQISFYLCIS